MAVLAMRTSPLVALTLASIAAAQSTHIVGPGAHPTIDAALAVAVAGDVVLVQPGNYPAFTASIGVTIRAVTSGTVFVAAGAFSGSTVQSTTPVHLVGLDIVFLRVNNTTCSLDQCRVVPQLGMPGSCLMAQNSRVHLADCVIGLAGNSPSLGAFTANAGLEAWTSAVSAVDSTFRGREPDSVLAGAAGPAVALLFNATFHGSGLLLTGGTGASLTGSSVPGPAIRASSAIVWIADSTLAGGALFSASTTPVWCPVEATAGRLARCTLLPASCAPPAIPLTGPAIGVHRVAPPQAGGSLQVTFRAAANEFVGVFASFALGGATFLELEQPVGLDLAMLLPLDVLVTDGMGLATGTWNLPPGTSNLALWLQAVTPGALPLQLSPATGGVVR